MKKLLYILVVLVLCSCQPSPTQKFEDLVKEVTGKSVTYDRLLYDVAKEQDKDAEMYCYFIDYGDDPDDKMCHDYLVLLYKVDSLMKKDFRCDNSLVDLDRNIALRETVNRRMAGDDNAQVSPQARTMYNWMGRDENGKNVFVTYNLHFSNENSSNNYIGLDISKRKR